MNMKFSEDELYKIALFSYIPVLMYHMMGFNPSFKEQFPFVALLYAVVFFYSFFRSRRNRWFYILIYICVLIILIATILVGSKNISLVLGGKLVAALIISSPFINLSNHLIGQERIVFSLGFMILVMTVKMFINCKEKKTHL